jgi:5S rRNA maturation endonuclease (ribonuclease M5)
MDLAMISSGKAINSSEHAQFIRAAIRASSMSRWEKTFFAASGDCTSNPALHNGGGNLLDLVRVMEGIDEPNSARKAALLIQEWFGLASPRTSRTPGETRAHATPRAPAPRPEQPAPAVATTPDAPQHNTPLPFAFRHLDINHAYLKERGFLPETIAFFEAGYHGGKGIMKGRIVVPIHNVDGELVAYAGRWPGSEPPESEGKYKLPPGFRKSLEIFGLHRAKACARAHGLVVVEGYFDVMRLYQSGICHAVAIMGSTLSEAQERLIVDTVGPQGRVTLCFDGDQSGQTATQDALERLSQHIFVRVVKLDEGIQPDDLQPEEIKALFL